MPFTYALFLIVLAAPQPPDLVVVNANVITMDVNHPAVEAFAVRAGRFTHVGSNADVKSLAGPQTRVLDLAGKTVVPGFIDAHTHPQQLFDEDSPWYTIQAGPDKVKTMDDLIAAIRRKAQKKRPGEH